MSEADTSSLLSQLLQKKMSKLQPTQTKVTSVDGSVSIYGNQGSQNISNSNIKSFGFVVDTKPDLTVGTVLPWLLISSQDVPNDLNLMSQCGVTHVLSLLPDFVLDPCVTQLIPPQNHLCLEVYDEEGFDLGSESSVVTKSALEFINSVKDVKGTKVSVHCNAGISRAPSVVLLYLMKCQRLSFDEAWALVQEARPAMKPNDGFLRQLKALNFKD